MGVNVYSPCRTKLVKRSDRPSSLRREEPLFPGYLFLQCDALAVDTHYSKITALNGAYGFVRFGGDPVWVQGEIVEALKAGLLLRTDPTLRCVDYHNLPSELEKAIHLIIEMRSDIDRKAAFFALLQQSALLERLASRAGARIYTALHPL